MINLLLPSFPIVPLKHAYILDSPPAHLDANIAAVVMTDRDIGIEVDYRDSSLYLINL